MDDAPSSGWYPDPEQPGFERYWTGQGWGPRRALPPPAPAPRPGPPFAAPPPAGPATQPSTPAWTSPPPDWATGRTVDAHQPSGPPRRTAVILAAAVVVVVAVAAAAFALFSHITWWRSPAWKAGYDDVTAGVPQNRPVWLPPVTSARADLERAAQTFCTAAWPVAQTVHDLPRGDEAQYVAGCQAGWVEISDRLAAP